jgi:hypothetical protein
MADVCIICQKEVGTKGASKVKDDKIIELIRSLKTATKTIQNNKLWVCEKDMEEYAKRRKGFEKDIVFFGVLGVGVVLLMVGLPLLGGNFNIGLFLLSVLIGGMIFLFGALLKYIPGLEKGLPKTESRKPEAPKRSSKK